MNTNFLGVRHLALIGRPGYQGLQADRLIAHAKQKGWEWDEVDWDELVGWGVSGAWRPHILTFVWCSIYEFIVHVEGYCSRQSPQ